MPKTKTETGPQYVPVAHAALARGISRERVIRMIQIGKLKGKFEDGRWLVDSRELAGPVSASN